MNKKLLLVSLLAVGMLVGCGNNEDPTSTPSSDAPTSEAPTTSEDNGGGEEGQWTGKFGNAGYYLVGEMNAWNNFWKYEGFHHFEFTQDATNENVYTLNFSVTEELLAASTGDTADAVDFKVMYWDGNKAPSEWWPDGVANNGTISEAGEYKLTFNKASTETAEKTDGSGTYTKYTTAEKIGDVNPDTAFVQGDARQFDPTFGKVTYKVAVDLDLEIPTGKSIYIHTWGLQDKDNNDVSGYFEMSKLSEKDVEAGEPEIWGYTTAGEVYTDDGTGVGMNYGFCIIVDDAGKTEQNWDYKVSSSQSADGNYGIHVTTSKRSATAQLLLEDAPYWLKGTLHAPYSVAEAVAAMQAEGYVADTEMAVSGVVTKVQYQENFDSYNIWLEVPENASYEFQIYSGKLGEGLLTPEVGDTVVANGKSKIYTPKDETKPVVYELAYASSHKVSPEIVDVIRLSDYYMRGSFDESWNALSTHQFRMTGEATQELTVAVAAGTEFKVAVADWTAEANASHLVLDASVAEGTFSGESNIKCEVAGTYRFVLDLSGEAPVLTVYAA